MTEIGPGTGEEIFDELEAWTVFPDDGRPNVFDWDDDTYLEFVNALWMSAPFVWRGGTRPFSFVASSSLHGSSAPYYDWDRRARRLQKMLPFAALYADQVIIPDPFEVGFRYPSALSARIELVENLLMIRELRPLIEAGIVVFGPREVPVCEEGKRILEGKQIQFYDRIQDALSPLSEDAREEIRVTVQNTIASGPGDAGTAEICQMAATTVGPLLGDMIAELGANDLRENPERLETITELALDRIVNDLHYHAMLSWLHGVKYLTDRSFDHYVLSALAERPPISPEVGSALTHELPVCSGLDAETIVRLREEEGEAFALYRSKIAQTIRATSGDPASQVADAFDDLVRPELARLDAAVANTRKLAKRRIRENLVFGTGLATLGIGTGMLAPDIGAITTALGGLKFGSEILKDLNSLVAEPAVARENDFYFLWRLGRDKN